MVCLRGVEKVGFDYFCKLEGFDFKFEFVFNWSLKSVFFDLGEYSYEGFRI